MYYIVPNTLGNTWPTLSQSDSILDSILESVAGNFHGRQLLWNFYFTLSPNNRYKQMLFLQLISNIIGT